MVMLGISECWSIINKHVKVDSSPPIIILQDSPHAPAVKNNMSEKYVIVFMSSKDLNIVKPILNGHLIKRKYFHIP
jgi:hypothetical protein